MKLHKRTGGIQIDYAENFYAHVQHIKISNFSSYTTEDLELETK